MKSESFLKAHSEEENSEEGQSEVDVCFNPGKLWLLSTPCKIWEIYAPLEYEQHRVFFFFLTNAHYKKYTLGK